jgi:hypothetical protein
MSLEKVTQLASIEVIFPSRAINVAWHTYITEDGVIISGPSVHRKAFPGEDISEVLPEIADFVSAEYLQLVSEGAQQSQLVAQLQAAVAERQARIAELEALVQALQAGEVTDVEPKG